MKGFLEWFKSGAKMKRWMLLILVGIILACYGMAEVLVLKEVSFTQIGKIAAIFIVGFTCIILGLIFLFTFLILIHHNYIINSINLQLLFYKR